MKDNDYQIFHNEVISIANYAESSRTMKMGILRSKNQFYNNLLHSLLFFNFNPFLNNFLEYTHIRLKLALSTRDFSCVEFAIWIIYRFYNNKNISERSKSEIVFLDYNNHKFLCLTREYKIFSPIQKFTKHKKIIANLEDYDKLNFGGIKAHLIDHTFMLEHFKNIALIDDNIQLKPYYNVNDLQSFETLPDEVKKVVQPLRDAGYI
jgi:hypothetical protein